jgi:hypothetical protein
LGKSQYKKPYVSGHLKNVNLLKLVLEEVIFVCHDVFVDAYWDEFGKIYYIYRIMYEYMIRFHSPDLT